MNILYWGGGTSEVDASIVCGKCEVICGEDIEGDKDEWFLKEADRFYFYEAYDSAAKTFVDPPSFVRTVKGKGKVRPLYPFLRLFICNDLMT